IVPPRAGGEREGWRRLAIHRFALAPRTQNDESLDGRELRHGSTEPAALPAVARRVPRAAARRLARGARRPAHDVPLLAVLGHLRPGHDDLLLLLLRPVLPRLGRHADRPVRRANGRLRPVRPPRHLSPAATPPQADRQRRNLPQLLLVPELYHSRHPRPGRL